MEFGCFQRFWRLFPAGIWLLPTVLGAALGAVFGWVPSRFVPFRKGRLSPVWAVQSARFGAVAKGEKERRGEASRSAWCHLLATADPKPAEKTGPNQVHTAFLLKKTARKRPQNRPRTAPNKQPGTTPGGCLWNVINISTPPSTLLKSCLNPVQVVGCGLKLFSSNRTTVCSN